MAITITQERKKQRYLILVFALMIFITLFIVWWGFSSGKENLFSSAVSSTVYVFPEIEIDWGLLEDISGKKFQPFEEISAFEGEFGRENPFTHY